MVGPRILLSRKAHRVVARVLIRLVLRVIGSRRLSAHRVTERFANSIHQPPSLRLLGINLQRSLRSALRFAQKFEAACIGARQLRRLEKRLGELVEHARVNRKVKAAFARARKISGKHTTESLESLGEISVLLINERGEVHDRPRTRRLSRRGLGKQHGRIVETTFLDGHTRARQ